MSPPTCPRCGSLLSIVTWACVRGHYCRPKSAPSSKMKQGVER